MARADLIAGVLLMGFGLVLLIWIIPAQTEPNTGAAVAPALLPQICAVGITILAAVLTLNGVRGVTVNAEAPKKSEWAAMVAVVTFIILTTVLFKYVHAAVAGAFVCLATMLFMGERRWWALIGLPGALVLGVYLLFYEFLGTAIR